MRVRIKDRIAQSKRARAGSLAIVEEPQAARTCILSFSGVTFVSFCFVTTVSATFFVSISSFFYVSLEMSLFRSIFWTITVFLRMESTSYVFSFRMVYFYLVTTGCIFDMSLLCKKSIYFNQSTNQSSINHHDKIFARSKPPSTSETYMRQDDIYEHEIQLLLSVWSAASIYRKFGMHLDLLLSIPPQSGGNMSKRLGGIIVGCKYKKALRGI